MQPDHPQTPGRRPERRGVPRGVCKPGSLPSLCAGERPAPAFCTSADPFGMRAAHGRERRSAEIQATAPAPALPLMLEPRIAWGRSASCEAGRLKNRRLFLLPRDRGSCRNIHPQYGRLAGLSQLRRHCAARSRKRGIYSRAPAREGVRDQVRAVR